VTLPRCPAGRPLRLPSDAVKAVIFSEDALAPIDRLWTDAVDHLARRLGRVKPLDTATIPVDRSQALEALEAWADGDVSTWRAELARYYEDHIPVYVRPNPELNAVLRHLQADGTLLASWSPGPPEVGVVVTHFLGLTRRLDHQRVDPAATAAVSLIEELELQPVDALVVGASPAPLVEAKNAGALTAGALWTGGDRDELLAAHPAYLLEQPAELVQLALA
jgi:phosphoglycolate phosphatase-like HAD superfamily hydrolase